MKLRVSLLVIIWSAVFFLIPRAAYAYIDPATTTYIIQVFTAIIITLGVTLSIVVYRLQTILMNLRMAGYRLYVRVFKKQQGADNKTDKHGSNVDKPEYITPDYVLPGSEIGRTAIRNIKYQDQGGDQKYREGSIGYLLNDTRKFRLRLLIAVLLAAAFSVTFIIFGPLDLLSANTDALGYLLPGIITPILLAGLAVFVILTVILVVFKGRLFSAITCVLLAIIIAGYLQGNFLNPNLGELTGDAISWHSLRTQSLLNLAVWVGILVVCFAVKYFSKKFWQPIIIFIPSILIVAQVVALFTLAPNLTPTLEPGEQLGVKEVLSTKGLTQVSPEKNTVVFLLDRFDQDYVGAITSQDPDFFDQLDGFTEFTNNITHYRWTSPSLPDIFTGYKNLDEDKKDEFLDIAWRESDFVPTIRQQDYATRVYSDSLYSKPSQVRGLVDNLVADEFTIDQQSALKRMLLLSAFKYAPIAMKAPFWTSTGELQGLYSLNDTQEKPYVIDDVLLYQTFKTEKLQPTLEQNNFTFYHLMGPHAPIYYNENVEYALAEESSAIRQAKGSFEVVFEYIRQLKELGLYEDATIIVTADHGEIYGITPDDERIDWWENPNVSLLFVKPAGQVGTPLQFDSAPVTTENFRATVIQSVGGSTANYGETYFEVPEDSQIERRFYWHENWPEFHYLVLGVKGDANNPANWYLIEEIDPDGTLNYIK